VTSKRSGIIVGLASAVVILAGLKLARDLLVPVLLGMMAAAVSSPVVTFLLKRRIPPIVVAVAALALDVMALTALASIFVAAAADLTAFIPRHATALEDADIGLARWLSHHGIHDVSHPLSPVLHGEHFVDTLAGAADTFAGVATLVVIVLLVAFFTLCEVTLLGDKLRALVSDAEAQFARINRIIHDVQRYLVVKVLVSLLAGVLAYIVLRVLRVELSLLLALILFMLHFLPAIGVPIAMVPAIAVALLSRGPGTAVAVALSYQVIAVFCGNVLEPRLLGRTIGLSPLTVLLSMLFWGWMWGPLGAILAVPLTAIAKIVLENQKGLEGYARLLETTASIRRPAHPFLEPPRYVIGTAAPARQSHS
jgi:AI-2 transport protein TqsA